MKIYRFFVQAENGFQVCIATINAIDIIQAIYRYEKNVKIPINQITKIELNEK